jgi:Ca2+/Na+ antiporter
MTEETTLVEPAPPVASKRYRPATTMTLWMKLLVGGAILASVLEFIFRIFEYRLLGDIASGAFDVIGESPVHALTMSDARVSFAAYSRMILFFAAALLFLFWTFRANCNALALGAREMRYTPGWSVGWFFVPFANLVMPFKVMREIWQASSDPGNQSAKSSSAVVGWWWFAWLANTVAAYAVGAMFKNIDGVEAAQRVSAAAMVHDLVQIGLYVAIFALVKGIFDRQQYQATIVTVF